jgi:hypothetical protein
VKRRFAARTLTRPGEVVSVPFGTPPAAQEKAQADPGSAQDERPDPQRSGGMVPSAPTSVAAVAKVPAASVLSPTKPRFHQGPAPTQKKASRKPHPTSRYAWPGFHCCTTGDLRSKFAAPKLRHTLFEHRNFISCVSRTRCINNQSIKLILRRVDHRLIRQFL